MKREERMFGASKVFHKNDSLRGLSSAALGNARSAVRMGESL